MFKSILNFVGLTTLADYQTLFETSTAATASLSREVGKVTALQNEVTALRFDKDTLDKSETRLLGKLEEANTRVRDLEAKAQTDAQRIDTLSQELDEERGTKRHRATVQQEENKVTLYLRTESHTVENGVEIPSAKVAVASRVFNKKNVLELSEIADSINKIL